MRELQHIVTATDCTDSSSAAVERGFHLAAESGAQYTLAHGLGLDSLTLLQGLLADRLPEISTSLLDEAKRRVTEQADEGQQRFGVTATVEVSTGQASNFVSELAEARDADVLLLGGTSADLLHRAIMGSTASRLQRTSPCPVLTVKQPVSGPYRRALVAVDFSPDCDALVHAAQRVAPEAHLVLLHAFEVPFEGKLHVAGVAEETVHDFRVRVRERAAQRLRELIDQHGLSTDQASTVAPFGEPAAQILDHEAAYDCDLIVMGRHNPLLAERLLLGSVTKKVVAEARNDVLVVLQQPREPTEQTGLRL